MNVPGLPRATDLVRQVDAVDKPKTILERGVSLPGVAWLSLAALAGRIEATDRIV